MARADILNILYSMNKSPSDFNFDALMAPPLFSLISVYDTKLLHDIAIDPRLSSKVEKKYEYIKQILTPRGFVRFAGGTNRIVYRFKEDQSFVLKVGFDKYGITDSPAEYKNQQYLKPFVTKTFDHSPCGTVGLSERVEPITSLDQFMSLAPDIYEMLTKKIIGKFVLEDIGTLYFKNYGIRMVNPGTGSQYAFGPVILDYPYMYELDGEKLFCNCKNIYTGEICDGQIDYDDGFNKLVCEKCGCEVRAFDLRKKIETNNIIVKGRKESNNMKVACYLGDTKVSESDTTKTVKSYTEVSGIRKSSKLKVSFPDGIKPLAGAMEESKKSKEELRELAKKQTEELIKSREQAKTEEAVTKDSEKAKEAPIAQTEKAKTQTQPNKIINNSGAQAQTSAPRNQNVQRTAEEIAESVRGKDYPAKKNNKKDKINAPYPAGGSAQQSSSTTNKNLPNGGEGFGTGPTASLDEALKNENLRHIIEEESKFSEGVTSLTDYSDMEGY